jgi:Fungal protein kinase
MLRELEGCIAGYQSLHELAGVLQRDIFINNLMINEDATNPSGSSFLIDLDLAGPSIATSIAQYKGNRLTGTISAERTPERPRPCICFVRELELREVERTGNSASTQGVTRKLEVWNQVCPGKITKP